MHTRRKLLFWTRGMTRKMFVLKNGLTLRDNEIYLCVCDWWPWKPRELSGNNAVLSLMQSKKWMSFSFFVIFSPLFLADPLRSWCSSLRAVQPFSLYSGLGGGQACNPTGQRCNFHGVHASHKWSRFVKSYLKDSQALRGEWVINQRPQSTLRCWIEATWLLFGTLTSIIACQM